MSRGGTRLLLAVAYTGWLGFWLWAFWLSYSPRVLALHTSTRVPALLLSLLAVLLPPLSAMRAVAVVRHQRRAPGNALLRHLAVTTVPLLLLVAWLTAAGLATGRARWWRGPTEGTLAAAAVDLVLCALVVAATTIVTAAFLVLATGRPPASAEQISEAPPAPETGGEETAEGDQPEAAPSDLDESGHGSL